MPIFNASFRQIINGKNFNKKFLVENFFFHLFFLPQTASASDLVNIIYTCFDLARSVRSFRIDSKWFVNGIEMVLLQRNDCCVHFLDHFFFSRNPRESQYVFICHMLILLATRNRNKINYEHLGFFTKKNVSKRLQFFAKKNISKHSLFSSKKKFFFEKCRSKILWLPIWIRAIWITAKSVHFELAKIRS